MSKSKTKIVLSEETEPENKEEKKDLKKKEDFVDYLFRFGKYKGMTASDIVKIKTISPKTNQPTESGKLYLMWCLKNVLFLTNDDKKMIQQILDNYAKK